MLLKNANGDKEMWVITGEGALAWEQGHTVYSRRKLIKKQKYEDFIMYTFQNGPLTEKWIIPIDREPLMKEV